MGLSLSRGWLAGSPVRGAAAPYWRKLAWSSATFAFLADLAMGTLGGDLKRKEKLTGRFCRRLLLECTSAPPSCVATRPRASAPRTARSWSGRCSTPSRRSRTPFDGLFANLTVPGATWLFRGPVAAWSRLNRISALPSDRVGHRVAAAMLVPGEQRDRPLRRRVLVARTRSTRSAGSSTPWRLCYQAEGVVRKVKDAVKRRELPKAHPAALIGQAVEAGVITPEEAALLQRAEEARNDAIQVGQLHDGRVLRERRHAGRVRRLRQRRTGPRPSGPSASAARAVTDAGADDVDRGRS